MPTLLRVRRENIMNAREYLKGMTDLCSKAKNDYNTELGKEWIFSREGNIITCNERADSQSPLFKLTLRIISKFTNYREIEFTRNNMYLIGDNYRKHISTATINEIICSVESELCPYPCKLPVQGDKINKKDFNTLKFIQELTVCGFREIAKVHCSDYRYEGDLLLYKHQKFNILVILRTKGIYARGYMFILTNQVTSNYGLFKWKIRDNSCYFCLVYNGIMEQVSKAFNMHKDYEKWSGRLTYNSLRELLEVDLLSLSSYIGKGGGECIKYLRRKEIELVLRKVECLNLFNVQDLNSLCEKNNNYAEEEALLLSCYKERW